MSIETILVVDFSVVTSADAAIVVYREMLVKLIVDA